MYNIAASVAVQRLPWEHHQLMLEELSMILSNRSTTHVALGDHISGLADAEAVIRIKRVWSKGYFRKAKALVELGRLVEAKETVEQGLVFEPGNSVSFFQLPFTPF